MTSEAMPEPRKSKRDELVEALELDYVSMALHHSNRAIAERIVDRVIQAGWQWHPPKLEDFDLDFNEVALPYPTAYALRTPEEEIDIMDRIISGLPARVLTPANPDGVHVYDVNSLYPKEVNLWKRIPEFDNYEANPFGVVRNRWTRRVLDVAKIGDQESVEMHDKDGFPHELNIRYIIEKTFDN